MNSDKKILVGSCGGLTGTYLIRRFQKMGYHVVGADVSKKNSGYFFSDEFIELPPASAASFLSELISALKKYDISYYFPTHSKEIVEISRQEIELRKEWHGNFMVSPYATFEKLNNKRNANFYLRQAGIPVPKIIDRLLDSCEYPIFMKPDEGSGSRQSGIVENAILHDQYRNIYPTACFFERIEGKEFTVDCIFDQHGKLLAYNQRSRLKQMGGAVIVTQNDYDFNILPWLQKLADQFVFKGCVNFQYILRDNTPYFIDINLRYASGGMPLTVESGIDMPQISLKILDGCDPGVIRSCPAPGKIMYRYFNELFEDDD